MVTPQIRASRILSGMERFRSVQDSDLPNFVEPAPIRVDESIIGVYENNEACQEDCVVITDQAILHFSGGNWSRVDYVDIEGSDCPPPGEVGDRQELALRTPERTVKIPIRGNNGRFYDIYEFQRFVIRVVNDVA